MSYAAKEKEIQLLFTESEKMYKNLIESVKNGIYMADLRGKLFFVNHSMVEIFRYNHKDEMLGLNILSDLCVDLKPDGDFIRAMKQFGFVRDYEIKIVRKDGTSAVLSTTSNYIHNEKGETIGVQGIVYDITEKKELENRLHIEKMKLEEILSFDETISSILKLDKLVEFIVEKTTAILDASKCSLMLIDESTNELYIKSAKGLSEQIIAKTRIKLGENISGRVAKEGRHVLVTNIEYDKQFERKNRASYKSCSFMSAAIKSKKKLLGVINVADKHTGEAAHFDELDLKILSAIVRQSAIAIENANLYKELEHLSQTDPLTNLNNYRYFVRSVDDEIQRFKRFSHGFCLMMIDVDGFKKYNDTFGHLAGDAFLKELGELLTDNLRSIDKACRYGGDEFAILLPETDIEQARKVAEKLRRKVENHPFKKSMTISIGLVEFKKPLSRFEFTLAADKALYQAKRSGKNVVHEYAS